MSSLSAAAPGINHRCLEAAAEIGFTVPERYNASELLFDNLDRGRGTHLAITGPGGSRTYGELCGDAARYGLALRNLGLTRGDRVLFFLDDTPTYPAAFFGALRAGLVPVLINTLTSSDLLNFYLKDSCRAGCDCRCCVRRAIRRPCLSRQQPSLYRLHKWGCARRHPCAGNVGSGVH